MSIKLHCLQLTTFSVTWEPHKKLRRQKTFCMCDVPSLHCIVLHAIGLEFTNFCPKYAADNFCPFNVCHTSSSLRKLRTNFSLNFQHFSKKNVAFLCFYSLCRCYYHRATLFQFGKTFLVLIHIARSLWLVDLVHLCWLQRYCKAAC